MLCPHMMGPLLTIVESARDVPYGDINLQELILRAYTSIVFKGRRRAGLYIWGKWADWVYTRGRQDLFIFDLKSNQSLDLLFLILDLKINLFQN
jgi:hypothetical protein